MTCTSSSPADRVVCETMRALLGVECQRVGLLSHASARGLAPDKTFQTLHSLKVAFCFSFSKTFYKTVGMARGTSEQGPELLEKLSG